MKKQIIIIALIVITTLTIISYSNTKFKSYNLIGSIYGVINLKESNPTHTIEENKILIDINFKNTYMNYLTELYEQQNWTLKEKTIDKYEYCNENECHTYKLYSNKFLFKKYIILIKV